MRQSTLMKRSPVFACIFSIHFLIMKREEAFSKYSEPSRSLVLEITISTIVIPKCVQKDTTASYVH